MTLNITLVTQWGIHQSADYRLMDVDLKKQTSNNSPKLVQLNYFSILINITYCGIGRWRNQDTSYWLKKWLSHEFTENRSFEDVINTIKTKGTNWLVEISNYAGVIYPHTFIVTAFIKNKPQIAFISNFERLDSSQPIKLTTTLQISSTIIHRNRVFITGIKNAVNSEDVQLIRSLGAPPVNISEIQRIIALVNSRAAKNRNSQGAISDSCWVYSNLPGGASEGKCFGKVDGKLTPIILSNGIDLLDQIQLIPLPGREIQMLSSTTVTSDYLARKQPFVCKPRLILPKKNSLFPDFKIIGVGDLGGSTSRINSINKYNFAVGESFLTPSGPSHALLWQEKKLHDLGTLGGQWSVAKDINDENQVVGTSALSTNDSRAFIWNRDDGIKQLGTLGGRHSNATSINNNGIVVGSSWITLGENPENSLERAFIWDKLSGIQEIGSFEKTWSRALSINDKDQVVVISPKNGNIRGFLFEKNKPLVDIGTLGGKSCNPVGINNNGVITGMSETIDGKQRPFIWSENQGMIELNMTGELFISGISDDDFIVGTVETNHIRNAFVYSLVTEKFMLLPSFEHHNSEAISIHSDLRICGQIIGAEMHCHGIIWEPLL